MIYLIYGDEQYLVNEELSRIIKKHPNAAVEKFTSPALDKLIEIIITPSLFSAERLLVVADLKITSESERFVSCISSLPPGVILVIKNPIDLDKRYRAYKTIESLGEVCEFKSIPEWEEDKVAEFVVKAFAKYGKEINSENAYLLVEGVGRNLGLLNSEIDKISTYIGNKKVVERLDIESLMIRSGWDSFSVVQALLKKDAPSALEMLDRLLAEKEDPVQLLALIASQFRMLFKVKLLASESAASHQISRRLKASPYYINRLYEASRNFKLKDLEKGLEVLYDTDLRLKTGFNHKSEMCLLISDLTSNA